MSSANLSNSHQFEIASSANAAEAKPRYFNKSFQAKQGVSVATYVAMVTIAVIGLALTSYLGWASATSTKVAGCGSGQLFDCSHVMNTKWSSAFGIPVGIPAAGLYVGLLASMIVWSTAKSQQIKQYAKTFVAGASFIAAVAAVWFISLQLFVVEHLCQYCLAAHACGLILVGLSIWNLSMSKMKIFAMSAMSLVAVGVMATSQVMAEAPPTFEIETHAPVTTPQEVMESNENAADVFAAPGFDAPKSKSKSKNSDGGTLFEAPISGATSSRTEQNVSPTPVRNRFRMGIASLLRPASLMVTANPQDDQEDQEQEEERLVGISGGSIKLNVAHWPLSGNADAEKIFIEMFDYTCPHCRENFKTIQAAKEQMGEDKIATMVLCVPMNSNCNGTVRVNHAKHAEACELAKLAVAVWRVDPEQFQVFHEWMFEGDQAPTAAAARAKAIELVDEDALTAELEGEVVQQYISKQVQLYQNIGGGTVPKMLFSGTTVVGKVTSTDILIQIIDQQN